MEIIGWMMEITGWMMEITGRMMKITGEMMEITGEMMEITGWIMEITGVNDGNNDGNKSCKMMKYCIHLFLLAPPICYIYSQ